MQEERVRLNSTDSVNSVNKENFIDVEIKQHTKLFPFSNIIDTIDQRQQFETERENCTKYRFILTVNPYCSNILFNTVTEIVQNEGSNETDDNENKLTFVNSNSDGITVTNTGGYSIKGKQTNVTNVDMVRNTEYANGERPFVYHCGWDIFNNHILRNQTFKLVNSYTTKPTDTFSIKDKDGNEVKKENKVNVFNTIRDFMRDGRGTYIKLHRRTDINTIDSGRKNKRLYLRDDVMSFEDSANANIYEQNGWLGFNNRSSIVTTEWKEKKDEPGQYECKDMQTAKVFNDGDSLACGFIEMYPDSSLYSFSPKYNKFQNREEHNWDICITYPYKNDYGYEYNEDTNTIDLNVENRKLIVTKISDNNIINALLLANVRKTKGTSGQDILLFRSFVKHNLKTGDKFKLFYSLDKETYTEIKDILFEVVNIGNLKSEYQDYYFYINNIKDIYDNIGSEILDDYSFRFIKIVNNRECKYYFRKFRKLPNFKFKKRDLTVDDVYNDDKFNKYIEENCMKEGKMLLFGKEQYPLAFSNTVYGDGNTQIVFTDSIDIDKLTDNLGRPITELYITFIKRNKGHDVWYNQEELKKEELKKELKKIEFSHCFSEVISGLKIHNEVGDSDELKQSRKELGDITCITTKDNDLLDKDIDIDKTDEFYGDLVELDQTTMKETVLSDVCFRFNTEQRENGTKEKQIENGTIEESKCGKYVYDSIITDDYDLDGFVCDANELDVANIIRKEGYYYKAHYPIKVREFGAMRQGSHKEIKVSSCNPKQTNGMFIEVVSTLRSGVTSGSVVYLYDTEKNNEKVAELTVNSVQSNVRFLLNTMKREDANYISIFDIVKGLLYSRREIKEGEKWINENGLEEIAEADMTVNDYGQPRYIMRLKNIDIPHYAYEVGENSNIFLWRDVLNIGNKDTVELTEYPFANGHFYINKEINFFLKRQDPFGYNSLYASELYPNDIFGNVKEENIYEYKDETNVVC